MSPAPSTFTTRPFNFRLALGLPGALMLLLLVAEPHRLDMALAQWFYQPGEGFIGRHYDFLLQEILQRRVKQALFVCGGLAIALFLASLVLARLRPWRRRLSYLVLAITLCTGVIMPLKKLTNIHCPGSLTEFGGTQVYTPLLSARPADNKPGRCWPAGHASAGFALLTLYFFLRDRAPKSARVALVAALGLGSLFATVRMLQGAHFFSHGLWTCLIDWVICVLCYRALLYRSAPS